MRAPSLTAMAAAILGLKDGTVMRKLGNQESMFHVMDNGPVKHVGVLTYSLVVDCQRRLEAGHVLMALEALQRQIPALHARSEKRKDGRYMVFSSAPVCLTELPPGGDFQQLHMEKANNEELSNEPGGPHWKVALMRDPQNTTVPPASAHRAVLCLSMAHTFTDGLSQTLIWGRLLKNLDDALVKGRVEEGETAPVYSPMEDLLEQVPTSRKISWQLLKTFGVMFRDRNSPLLKAYVTPYDEKQDYSNPNEGVMTSVPPEEVARLRAKCRKHGVTVNSAISAAVSIAGARMAASPPNGPAIPPPYTLRTLFVVNLRRYFGTDIDRSQLYMSSAGNAASHVRVPGTSIVHFWPVAANIHRSIMEQIDMKMPIYATHKIWPRIFNPDKLDVAKEMEKAKKRTYSAIDYNVNNLGAMDAAMPKTTAVKPVEMHRMYRLHPSFDLSFGAHLFQTIGGRLCYDFNYTRGKVRRQDAQKFQDTVVQVLREVTTADE